MERSLKIEMKEPWSNLENTALLMSQEKSFIKKKNKKQLGQVHVFSRFTFLMQGQKV